MCLDPPITGSRSNPFYSGEEMLVQVSKRREAPCDLCGTVICYLQRHRDAVYHSSWVIAARPTESCSKLVSGWGILGQVRCKEIRQDDRGYRDDHQDVRSTERISGTVIRDLRWKSVHCLTCSNRVAGSLQGRPWDARSDSPFCKASLAK